MKKQLLFILCVTGIVNNSSAMDTTTRIPERKKSIFIHSSGLWVIGKHCREQKTSVNAKKDDQNKNKKELDTNLLDTEGNILLYNFLSSFGHNKSAEGKRSLQYLINDGPFIEEKDCQWFDQETSVDIALAQEIDYFKKRSQKTYQCLQEEIDIFESKKNSLRKKTFKEIYQQSKQAFKEIYRPSSSYYSRE